MRATTATFDQSGRIVVPAEYRRSLGLKAGDQVILLLEDNAVRLVTREQAIKEAQDIVAGFVPPDVSLVDELLHERREAAARE